MMLWDVKEERASEEGMGHTVLLLQTVPSPDSVFCKKLLKIENLTASSWIQTRNHRVGIQYTLTTELIPSP